MTVTHRSSLPRYQITVRVVGEGGFSITRLVWRAHASGRVFTHVYLVCHDRYFWV